jgi:uncharacterized coiled-coil DUF342 family protein
LDRERILQQFEEIEEKVKRLIEALKSLEATNAELRDKIQSMNGELQERIEGEKSYNEERDLIRSKIDSLLVRLEEIAETE